MGVGTGGLEGERGLQIDAGSSGVVIVEVGAGEDQVGLGKGLKGECGGSLAARFGKFVLKQKDVGKSGEGGGVVRLLGDGFAELAFGLADGAVGEELAGTLKVKRGALRGLGFSNGGVDGVLQLDGELAVGALVVIVLDAGEGNGEWEMRDGGDGCGEGLLELAGIGVIGTAAESLAELVLSAGNVSLAVESQGKIEVVVGIGGIGFDGFLEELGVIVTATAALGDSDIVEHLGERDELGGCAECGGGELEVREMVIAESKEEIGFAEGGIAGGNLGKPERGLLVGVGGEAELPLASATGSGGAELPLASATDSGGAALPDTPTLARSSFALLPAFSSSVFAMLVHHNVLDAFSPACLFVALYQRRRKAHVMRRRFESRRKAG